jgi:hypothetical protein
VAKQKIFINPGDRFGQLTAWHAYDPEKSLYVLCVCDCGNQANPRASNLVSGSTRSCGCQSGVSPLKNFVRAGDRFGPFTVINPEAPPAGADRQAEVICDNGHISTRTLTRLLTGKVKFCVACGNTWTPVKVPAVDKERLRNALKRFSPRDAQLLSMRFGLNGTRPASLTDVGYAFSISRERVRQIQKKALGEIQDSMRGNFPSGKIPGSEPGMKKR